VILSEKHHGGVFNPCPGGYHDSRPGFRFSSRNEPESVVLERVKVERVD